MIADEQEQQQAGRVQLVVLAGPSGVGKGTIVAELLHKLPAARTSVSATTREPRPGEVDGTAYHFLSAADFAAAVDADAFIEWAEYAGNRYGTLHAELEPRAQTDADTEVVLLEIEVQGASQLRERVPDALQIMITPPSLDELERRLRDRGTESEERIQLRLAEAKAELDHAEAFDAVVVNDSLDACIDAVAALITDHLTPR